MIRLRTSNVLRQIKAFQPVEFAGSFDKRFQIKVAVRVMGKRHMGRALLADFTGEAARVDAADPDAAAALQPGGQLVSGAPVGWLRGVPLNDEAFGYGVGCFVVFRVDADIADMREGKRHNLTCVGRVGHNLLITGHRRIETQFSNARTRCTEAFSVENRSICQSETGGRCLGSVRHGCDPMYLVNGLRNTRVRARGQENSFFQ